MTALLDKAFDALRQKDETTQDTIAKAVLDLVATLTPTDEADEVDEELEYLTSMTDEQYHAMQRWLINRHRQRLTNEDVKADTIES